MNISAHPPAGQPLTADWKLHAPLRANQATDSYLDRLQNGWRQPLTKQNDSELMQARLRTTDGSRCDALRLVTDDEDEQIWRSPGATVRIRKKP